MIRPVFTLLAVFFIVTGGLLWVKWAQYLTNIQTSILVQQRSVIESFAGSSYQLSGNDALQTATACSQAAYPASLTNDRPNAVILVRDDDPASAITATSLQASPVNAPILFLSNRGKQLPQTSKAELLRLKPGGVALDQNIHVYLVGNIGIPIVNEIQHLGFRARRLFALTPIKLAEQVEQYRAILDSTDQKPVFIGHLSYPEYLLPTANWNAFRGGTIAYITENGIPAETRRILQRSHSGHLYLLVPNEVLDASILAELSNYGQIQRIPGRTPSEISVHWSRYLDTTPKINKWFWNRSNQVGGGRTRSGTAFILANPADWKEVIASSVLSRTGYHASLLLTDASGEISPIVRNYLAALQPVETLPAQQIYNHGWVVGNHITPLTRFQFDRLLAIDSFNIPPE
jgi:hypothetical protein